MFRVLKLIRTPFPKDQILGVTRDAVDRNVVIAAQGCFSP